MCVRCERSVLLLSWDMVRSSESREYAPSRHERHMNAREDSHDED